MSDDAFASAQTPRRLAALSETDYALMRDALMETARGRGFLDEFARRNRNADTRMVLDAVARIESVVAAQQAPFAPTTRNDFGEILRRLIDRARADLGSISGGDDGEGLTQARRAARIIREIAWQMRACGNDPRICNILDAQLDAIDAALNNPAAQPDARLREVLDALIANIEAAADGRSEAPVNARHEDIAEDDAVLTRIAAEMATTDADPDADSFDEPHAQPRLPANKEIRKSSLGEMLIARGIIPDPGDRDAPANNRIN